MEYNKIFYGEAYCVKCKDKVTFEGQVRVSDSGRRMAFGKCPECGSKVNRILGSTPNESVPTLVTPVVEIPPQLPVYATMEIYKTPGGLWHIQVIDKRRGFGNTEHFIGFTKARAIRKAKYWLNSWSRREIRGNC